MMLAVLWDGATSHCSRAVKEHLSNGATDRVHLELLD
jgi:hypothetical protein